MGVCERVRVRVMPRNLPHYETEKNQKIEQLYFLQPDIKKITKHKSVGG